MKTSHPELLKGFITKGLRKDEKSRNQTVNECFSKPKVIGKTRIGNIMKAEQGIVGWDWDGKGYEYREFDITFSCPFKTPPIIQTSIQMIDVWPTRPGDTATRTWISVESIESSKAKIKVGSWAGIQIGGCKVSWLALGD